MASLTSDAAVTITRNDEARRYEAWLDGTVAGFTAYRTRPDAIVFTHTEVGAEYEGRGIGSALAHFALDDARARGAKIVAQCPFVAGYVQRHPAYADLVAS